MHRPRCSTNPPKTFGSIVPRVLAGAMSIWDTKPPPALGGTSGGGTPRWLYRDWLDRSWLYLADGSGGRDPDPHRARSPVVPLEVRDRRHRDIPLIRGWQDRAGDPARSRHHRVGGNMPAGCGELDRGPDARQRDRALGERDAGQNGQLVEPGGLVGLLEAVDQGAALDRDAAAHRVDPPVGVRPARGEVQVQAHLVARLPRPPQAQVAIG